MDTSISLFIGLLTIIFVLNLPFGYWREQVKKFSFQWFVAIHVPVLFIFLFRYLLHIQHGWLTTPFMVLSFFVGQRVGAQYYKRRHAK